MRLNEYHIAIRQLVEMAKRRGKTHQLKHYQIQSDEIYDPSLVSFRLYQLDKYVDVVQIICGVSYSHEALPERAFYFPTLKDILFLQRKYGINE